MYFRGGTGVVYNNTLTVQGTGSYSHYARLSYPRLRYKKASYMRQDLYGGVPSGSCCDTTEGYPCVDQPGRGQNKGVSPNKTQILDPIYFWNNTRNRDGTSSSTPGVRDYDISNGCGYSGITANHIQLGREFFSDNSAPYTQKPGYVPYEYPHPLTQGHRQQVEGLIPDTPTFLTIK
jgi:hypothetical protein